MAGDWTDADKDELDEAIAHALGWERRPDDPLVWWDRERERDSGWMTGATDRGPRWVPTEIPLLALWAAGQVAKRRGVAFTLRCSGGPWVAGFRGRVGELTAEHVDPRRAVCEAIVKLARLPDSGLLFGRESRGGEAT